MSVSSTMLNECFTNPYVQNETTVTLPLPVNNLKCMKSKDCTWKQNLKKYKITFAIRNLHH